MLDDIKATSFYKALENKNEKEFIAKVETAFEKCKGILSSINHIFNNYTVHNEIHSLNVMEYMAKMITNLDKLSSLDIVLCIYAALFHDIGMVVYDDEITKIIENKDPLVNYDFKVLMDEYENQTYALQEAIRPIHGKRVRTILERNKQVFDDLFNIPKTSISFMDELVNICQAHNEDFEWLKNEIPEHIKKGSYDANPQFVAILLRLADLLDIDENRAPQYLYLLLRPSGISDIEWKQHFVLENIDKVGYNSILDCKEIQFYGKSDDVNIHRKFLQYIDYFKDELVRATSFSERFKNEAYVLKISAIPKMIIDTSGFSFADFKLSLDYNAVTNLLMGENIYGDKKYGLRELLQNAIDACKVLNEFYSKNPNPYEKYKPQISLTIDEEKGRVSIFDNGNGMSLDILKNYFLNVGVSYYKSKDYRYMGYDYKPIGNYGIGFLACFMLSKNVKIITKQFRDSKASTIIINRDSEYVGISLEEIQFSHGTEIILDYNEFAKVFKDIEEVKLFIKKNFILDEVSISLNHIANGNNEKIELDLIPLNKMILLNVPLTKYLNDIEVYVDMKFSKSCFFKDLYDLTGNISYFYDEDDYKLHQESEERFDLFDYIEDEKIKFLNLAIIEEENSDEFNNAFNYLEDYEAALNKIDATYITIAYKDNQSVSYSSIEAGDAIIEYFGFENLVDDFGQANGTIAYAFKESQFVVVNQDDLFLGFELDRKINRYMSWKSTDELYCKDILVSNAHLTFPYFLNNLSINKVVLNSKNKDLIPNVTRNDFSNQMKKELSYAIGKAIHMWILDNHDLSVEERDLIALFIKKYYSDENKFYKQ